jgi:hypothetical protein
LLADEIEALIGWVELIARILHRRESGVEKKVCGSRGGDAIKDHKKTVVIDIPG